MVEFIVVIVLFLIVISDIKKMIIPNRLTLLLLSLSVILKGNNYLIIENSILGMGTYLLPFLIIYGYVSDFIKKDAIGFGDIKLMMSFGYILGYSDIINIYLFFIYSFILGSIVGIFIAIFKRKLDFQLPFSPFLSIIFIYFWKFR